MNQHTDRALRRQSGAVKPEGPKNQTPRHAALPGLAGNTAVRKLLETDGPAEALPAQLRTRIESSFGVPFDSVRVRDDSAAHEAASSLGAIAVTHGEEIALGRGAPAAGVPSRNALLAHEAAHVVQQRQAGAVRRDVDVPGDAFEQHAEKAAQHVLAGEGVSAGMPAGVPAALQRDTKPPPEATRAEVQQALQAYLERALQAQPEGDLRRNEKVRTVLENFVMAGGPMVFVNVKTILGSVRNDPAEIASQIAARLPDRYPRTAVDQLGKARTTEPTPSLPERVKDLVRKTEPAEQKIPPGFFGEGPKEKSDREIDLLKQATKPPPGVEVPKEKSYGPYKVDVLRLARIAKGLPKAIKPDKTAAPKPAARSYPDVEKAVQAVQIDALTPAEARGKDIAGNYADAQEFARDVGRQIDIAQQGGQDTVSIRLGDNYNAVADRAAMRQAIEDIIARIRAALPHHGSSVINVDVYFGDKLVTRGRRRDTQ